jgi:hypothetical protein
MKSRVTVLLLAAILPLAACDAGEEADAEPMQESEQMMTLPDTTADAVWSYLQEADYQDWALWPGKGELYEGTEPHGMLLTTYLNGTAHGALVNGSGPLPDGSIVVKENYRPDSTLAAVTVMYSSDGYDADFNDYFWAKYGADGSVQAAGRVETCQSCHSVGERGFLRTPVPEQADDGM